MGDGNMECLYRLVGLDYFITLVNSKSALSGAFTIHTLL